MKRRSGITMIELLVAMVLVVIVSIVAYNLFADEQNNYVRVREKIKVQGDARDAMRIMESEIRNAGFASVATANRIYSAASRCSDVWFNTNTGVALRATNNSTSIPAGDTIVFRSYQLGASATMPTVCGTGASSLFQEVGYRLKSGSLQRYFRTSTGDAINWVPFLNDVVSFQVQYGLAATPSLFLGDTSAIMAASNWEATTGTVVTCGPRCIQMGNWATVAGAWRTRQTGLGVRRGERYKVTFQLAGNPAFLRSNTTGTITGYDRLSLTAGIVNSTGAFLDSVVVWAGDTVYSAIPRTEIYLTMPSDEANVRFAIRGRLMTGATTGVGQTLNISNLAIEQVGAGSYLAWFSNPTAAQLGMTKAVRLTLLAKTQDKNKEKIAASFSGIELGDSSLPSYTATGADASRSHILLQRVIPVVNNGL